MQVQDTEELLRLAREADKIDRHRAELFASMIKTEAWQEYLKLLEAKLQIFSDQLLVPAGSMDGVIKSEWIKGTMSGLIMARDSASVSIKAAEDLRRTQANEDNDDAS